ncbi:toxin-antitoxin system HicB family antitoxin [Candidatus Desantisbacteria bacterium]|nr:toxin-antitoxin system HicB family antitoxin [Candidatus Desantisbacteria bacterium]
MKNNVSVLTIRIPKRLKNEIEKVSDTQGVSINQFALFAFTKEVVEIEDNKYFQKILKSKTREEILNNYDNIMSSKKYSKENIPEWDKI